MTNSQSKDIDCQSCASRITCMKTRQKTTNWVWIWPGKLGKLTLGKMKTGALILCHEDIMNMRFGLMKNHRVQMADVQSRLPGFCKLGTMTKQFWRTELTWKSVHMDSSWLKIWHTWSIFSGQYRGTINFTWPITDLKLWHPEQGSRQICK